MIVQLLFVIITYVILSCVFQLFYLYCALSNPDYLSVVGFGLWAEVTLNINKDVVTSQPHTFVSVYTSVNKSPQPC